MYGLLAKAAALLGVGAALATFVYAHRIAEVTPARARLGPAWTWWAVATSVSWLCWGGHDLLSALDWGGTAASAMAPVGSLVLNDLAASALAWLVLGAILRVWPYDVFASRDSRSDS
jgi:hypothetical protein